MDKGVLWRRREMVEPVWIDMIQLAVISGLFYIHDLPLPAGLHPTVKALGEINNYFLIAVAIYMSVRLLFGMMMRAKERCEE